MVLASNEWLNTCEDEQKATSGNSQTTTGATAAVTTPAPSNYQISGSTAAVTTTQTVTPIASSIITTSLTTERIFSSNNEIMSENSANEAHQPMQQQQQQTSVNQKSSISDSLPAAVNLNDENAPNTQEFVNNNSEVLNCDTSTEISNSNANATNANSNSSNCGGANENINTNNANLYSNPNSNTSTLQSAIVRQSKTASGTIGSAQSGSHVPLSCPITPQALSSALQSAMNASKNSNASGSQNTFLTTLDIGISNNAALQQTVKEISSAFCASLMESQSNMANNVTNVAQNVGSSSNISMNLESMENNGQAKIVLLCEANSHPFQTRTILLTPNIECKVGRLIAKSKASESNAIFDCKVLSRNHAVLWYTDDGKFWVKDTKSSNGTFINENKLGAEAAELHFGDIVKFGVDVLENSRKEVHGCIIAFVKLYLPDGREAISIDTTTQRSQYSGEGRISYEEMHRLNLYMQEVSQREKALKSKLFNIQNVLDATRKNSALCWQSLIAEDQLLHRINSLEKKLQIMEKNVPESVLRNEVLKLLEDKNSYQVTAKEALRKVYQERCDALQMLSKMELAYANSDSECKILRDQIMSTKQSLQDVNTRLQRLEADYNEYKEEAERKQQEIKEQEEQRIADISEKLQQRELECDDLRRRVSEFMLKRAELLDDEEKEMQLQAIEKLDAVIGDMDLGEDDDEEDELEGNEAIGDEDDGKRKEDDNKKECGKKDLRQPRFTKSLDAMNGVSTNFLISSNEKEVLKTASQSDVALKKIKLKSSTKESTILKWLQNSDLNQKEGSIDIFKAICNESDSSDEPDLPRNENDAVNVDSESGIDTNTTSLEEFKFKYKKSKNKLQNVQAILCQLVEAEMVKECYKSTGADVTEHINTEKENEALKFARKEDEYTSINNDERLALLKSSVALLNEACKELCDSLTEQELQKSLAADIKEISPPPSITVQTQLQNCALSKTSGRATSKLLTQDTMKPLTGVNEEGVSSYVLEENNRPMEQASTNDECTSTVATPSTIVSPDDVIVEELSTSNEVRAYQEQIKELNLKLEQVENDAQNTLELMQIECDTFKEKVAQLSKVVQKACEEKKELERLLDERTSVEKTFLQENKLSLNAPLWPEASEAKNEIELHKGINEELRSLWPEASETKNEIELHKGINEELRSLDNKSCADSKIDADFEAQLCDDLAAINSNTLQREEELIVYKERLEKTQNDNLQLRNEIAALLLKSGTQAQTHMIKQMLAYGTAVLAVIVYLFTMYF